MYEIGAESGRYYSLNVPLREGMDDTSESTHVLLMQIISDGVVQIITDNIVIVPIPPPPHPQF